MFMSSSFVDLLGFSSDSAELIDCITATPSLNIENNWSKGNVISSMVSVCNQWSACSWTLALVLTNRFAIKLYIFFTSNPKEFMSRSKILL